EDDCSADINFPGASELFDPRQNSLSDPLGPLASFRCTEFGILCGGQAPARIDTPALMSGCTSNEMRWNDPATQKTALVPIDFYQKYFARLKKVPGHIIPAAVMAPSYPFAVHIDTQRNVPALEHSCASGNGTFGDPPIRLQRLLDSFGDLATVTSICQD